MELSKKEFDDLVTAITKRVIQSLPEDLREQARTVLIVTADHPSPEQTDPDDDDELLGLYEGIPLTERAAPETILPDRITLFRRPLLDLCATSRELRDEIRLTLIHELGHFFGFSENQLFRMGLE